MGGWTKPVKPSHDNGMIYGSHKFELEVNANQSMQAPGCIHFVMSCPLLPRTHLTLAPSCRRRELQAHIYRLKQTLSASVASTTALPPALREHLLPIYPTHVAAVQTAAAPAVGTSLSPAEVRDACGLLAECDMAALQTQGHTAHSDSKRLESSSMAQGWDTSASQVHSHPPCTARPLCPFPQLPIRKCPLLWISVCAKYCFTFYL